MAKNVFDPKMGIFQNLKAFTVVQPTFSYFRVGLGLVWPRKLSAYIFWFCPQSSFTAQPFKPKNGQKRQNRPKMAKNDPKMGIFQNLKAFTVVQPTLPHFGVDLGLVGRKNISAYIF